MTEPTHEAIVARVEKALAKLPDNRYGLHVKADSIYCIDDRWWVVLETRTEPIRRSEIWDSIATIEELLEDQEGASHLKLSVTAA